MPNSLNSSDILIVGAGITGLSTYYHLTQLGYNVKVISSRSKRSITDVSAGIVSSGQSDLITRLYHSFGQDLGREIWMFGSTAFDYLHQFLARKGSIQVESDRLRVAYSDMEKKELKEAADQLQKLQAVDFQAANSQFSEASTLTTKQNVYTVQWPHIGVEIKPGDQIEDEIIDVIEEQDGVQLQGKKRNYKCELTVLAAHLGTQGLSHLPEETLVSAVEQWSEFEVERVPEGLPMGSLISWNFGYFWLYIAGPNRVRLGGARQVRPLAGIGVSEAVFSKDVEDCYRDEVMTKMGLQVKKVVNQVCGLSCRPCDELPLVGPCHNSHRILLATGFMGQGLAQGFYSGYCLAHLVDSGQSSLIPRHLWPERMRSF